jgi:hypothetical protein
MNTPDGIDVLKASVEDRFGRGLLTVAKSGSGLSLIFDTQVGEVRFDLTEESWRRLQDMGYQALRCLGWWDKSKDHTNCVGGQECRGVEVSWREDKTRGSYFPAEPEEYDHRGDE